MTDTADFIKDLKVFLARHDMSPSRLGRDALGDPNFVSDVFNDKISPTLRRVDTVREFMRKVNKGLI